MEQTENKNKMTDLLQLNNNHVICKLYYMLISILKVKDLNTPIKRN